MNISKIPTEVTQLFSSQEAREYRLVPYNINAGEIKCYGESNNNYEDTIIELQVLFGKEIIVEKISTIDFTKLLQLNYRSDGSIAQSVSFTTSPNFLMSLIEEAYSLFASDLHFESYESRCRVRFRIDGKLIEKYIIDKSHYLGIVNQIKILSNMDISEKRLPQDGRILYNTEGKKFDVRVSSLPTIYGEKIVLRLLTRHKELLILENLGFDSRQLRDYQDAINQPNGLILISGPTGSGKSTTLYATLIGINKEDNNILTIEDPIEYTIAGVNQVQLKEEIGLTFGNALRTFLRQDPDIIMLGEIRDTDTANMAIRSSLTGHLVFSTIHTNNAWGIISRLIDMGVHPYLISETIRICLAQRLVRILCPLCKSEVTDPNFISKQLGIDLNDYKIYQSGGCEKCYYTGYRGRKALYEVIPIDKTISNLIRNHSEGIDDYLKKSEIKTLKASALELLKQGETSFEELIQILYN